MSSYINGRVNMQIAIKNVKYIVVQLDREELTVLNPEQFWYFSKQFQLII